MVSLAIPQAAVQQWLRAGRIEKLPRIINFLLIILLAWQLAGLSWLLVPEPPVEAPVGSAEAPPVRQDTTVDERQIANWHLFGVVQEVSPVVEKTRPVDAPETRLKLTLHGVFASDHAENARAIVGDPRGQEESYAVGDPLPGGAKLSEIYPDRIILERGGRYETLRLPKELSPATLSVTPSRTPASGAGPDADRAAAFNRYRSEIKQNPASFLTYVRATPARQGGKFIGFTLQPGKESGVLQELGLQPGDIVTTINGVDIDSPAMGMKAMQALGEGDSVNVTLLRSGQQVSLSLTLPPSRQ